MYIELKSTFYGPVYTIPDYFSYRINFHSEVKNKGVYTMHAASLINVQYPCKMSDGKNKRPLDIPFVKWISNCPLDFCVSIGSNGRIEYPMDLKISIGILFVHWSIGPMDKWNVHWTFAFSVGQLTYL